MTRMHITHDEIEDLIKHVENVPGDFAEIGIHKAITTLVLGKIARVMQCQVHGFDSFEGMDAPGPNDSTRYPKGRFAFPMEKVLDYLKKNGLVVAKDFLLFKGYIPLCFGSVTETQTYRFAYLDVDNYEATKIGLEWIWPRINEGGLLLLDDHFPDNPVGGPLAIQEWLVDKNLTVIPLPDTMEVKTRLCLLKDKP